VNLHICIEGCFETTHILPTVNVGIQCTNLHWHTPEIPNRDSVSKGTHDH